jgi:hypothetical protein
MTKFLRSSIQQSISTHTPIAKHLVMGMFACGLALASGIAQADGLADLKSALARLQGQAPIKAIVEAKTWNRQGEGKELEERNGVASVSVEESAQGLHVLYSKEMLAKLAQEERAVEKDSKAKTPTLSALGDVNSSSLRPMISAAGNLSRSLEKTNFKGEKTDTYNGKPARVLNFEITIDKLSEKERKYVKKFEGSIDVWIAADGTPLGSRSAQTMHGRAFLVVTYDQKNEEESVYGLSGDRLIVLKFESKSAGAGMGEKGETKKTKTLQVM